MHIFDAVEAHYFGTVNELIWFPNYVFYSYIAYYVTIQIVQVVCIECWFKQDNYNPNFCGGIVYDCGFWQLNTHKFTIRMLNVPLDRSN